VKIAPTAAAGPFGYVEGVQTLVLAPRTGTALEDAAHATAASRYLAERLGIFYGVSTMAVVGFLVVMQVVDVAVGQWSFAESVFDPSQMAHGVAVLGLAALLLLLRRRTFTRAGLRILDAAGLLLVVSTALVVYSESYAHEMSPLVLTILCIFVIARAVVVPASVRQTVLLSLAAPVGVLAVQLGHGPQPFVIRDPHAPAFLVWHQTVMLFAVVIAGVAARVTFHLRHRLQEAQSMGEYRLDALVGEGGMGKVYRATHALLRRPTAIKILDPDIATRRTIERFEREVRLTSRLQHPSNVQIYDYGTTAEGVFYYAMEYLEGLDLLRILETTGPLGGPRLLHVLDGTCAALAEAHDLGLVHRDVKPANLMLCRRAGTHDVVKVLDYGIARQVSAPLDETGAPFEVAGTPDYMSPEVIRGEDVGPASDVYSLGVTAYQLLTGWRLFGARALGDQLAHHLHTEPIPPSQRLAGVPPDLEAVILRCLAKDPQARYADARELREALARCSDAGTWTPACAAAWWQALTPPSP
jgi:eukaryotic-like serine/threonine-protein kinase